MNISKIQVPIREDIKDKATQKAFDQGFSSIQEVMRLFLTQYASGNIDFKMYHQEYSINLINEIESKYQHIMDEGLKTGSKWLKKKGLKRKDLSEDDLYRLIDNDE